MEHAQENPGDRRQSRPNNHVGALFEIVFLDGKGLVCTEMRKVLCPGHSDRAGATAAGATAAEPPLNERIRETPRGRLDDLTIPHNLRRSFELVVGKVDTRAPQPL